MSYNPHLSNLLQFSGGILEHPCGNVPGTITSLVASEGCVQVCKELHDLASEGIVIIREVSK